MTENVCKGALTEKTLRKYILWALVGLIVTFAFVIFLVWAILHPHGPRFVLQDVTVYDFNTSQPNFLTSNLQVTLFSSNPNDKIGILYDGVDMFASYRNQEVTLPSKLPTTYQGHEEETVWSPIIKGFAVPVEPYLSQSMTEDIRAGMVLINIKLDGCVKWNVGSWVSACYRLHVNCPAYLTFSGHYDGAGRPIKDQLSQRCAVDV